MRFFRHDNHLLWFGVLAVVAVVLYFASGYFSTPTASTSTTPDTTSTKRVHFQEEATYAEDDASAATPTHTSQATPAAPATQPAQTTPTTPAASDAHPPNASVTGASVKNTPHTDHSNATPTHVVSPSQPLTPLHVFLDIAKQDFLKSPFVGRVVIRLFPEHAPRTTRNFAQLCVDKKYVNIPFHRVVKDFMIQGGDIVNQDGTGTFSIYGGEGSTFADEPFALAHSEPGLLSMANSGPNTNGSQFFILTQPAPHLDGKHVVFGKVVQGMEFVHDVEREVTDPNDRPIRKCYVLNCGMLEAEGDAVVAPPRAPTSAASHSPLQSATTTFAQPPFVPPNGPNHTPNHTLSEPSPFSL